MKIYIDHSDFIITEKNYGVSFHSEEEDGFMVQAQESLKIKLFSVHRLDKVTSGLMIFAKSRESASKFGELFKDKKIKKTYLALSNKKPAKKQGLIKGDMTKSRRGAYKLLRSLDNPAVTRFISELVKPGLRQYKLFPETGKTHQLRVAMKSIGAPILGDKLYGGDDYHRVCLHAYKLEFDYYGVRISAESEVSW